MHSDPAINHFVISIFLILILGLFLKRLKQPYVVGYILAGIILGPSCLHVSQDLTTISRLGSIGVIFLLFFAGMEMTPKRLSENWAISLLGTLGQVLITVGLSYLVGSLFDWSSSRTILIGFVLSLSSTAVVLKLLEDWHEINTRAGQNVIGILLMQDVIIIPMLIILGLLGGDKPAISTILTQISGGIILVALTIYLIIKDEIQLFWLTHFRVDHELQLFAALAICFGLSALTSYASLSSALGAYVAGMIISSARETQWVYNSLSSLKILFIAIFFVSIGMQLDISYVRQEIVPLLVLVFLALGINTLVNGLLLKVLGEDWRVSIYGGALLSQLGEFGYVLAALGYRIQAISDAGYKLILSLITFTLILSPLWIALIKRLVKFERHALVKI